MEARVATPSGVVRVPACGWAELERCARTITASERASGCVRRVAIGDAEARAGSPVAVDAVASSEDIRACDCTATVPPAGADAGPSSVGWDMDGP